MLGSRMIYRVVPLSLTLHNS